MEIIRDTWFESCIELTSLNILSVFNLVIVVLILLREIMRVAFS